MKTKSFTGIQESMKAKSFCLSLNTKKAPEFIDITDWVCQCVAQSRVSNGLAVV